MPYSSYDALSEYLLRDERFGSASNWLPPRRVDVPSTALSQYHESLADDADTRDFTTYTDFMVFAWPAQLSHSNEPGQLGNLAERLVIEARLRLASSPARPLDDLTDAVRDLSNGAPPPLNAFLLDCWDATSAMLSPWDESHRSRFFALGRLLSAHAVWPGWGTAVDIAMCADWVKFAGNEDVFGIEDAIYRAFFERVGDYDDAPSWVYLQAMLVEPSGAMMPGRAVSLAKHSVRRPEHPWIDLYLGDQILCATNIKELSDDSLGGWPLRLQYAGDPGAKSVLVPVYALPNEDLSPEIEDQRSFGRSLTLVASSLSIGASALLPRREGLDCAYTAFGRAYIANGTQPGGVDDVLALNAAAALTRIGALSRRKDLFKCASRALLTRLEDAHLEPGSIPELRSVAELALKGGSAVRKSRRAASVAAWRPTLPSVVIPSVRKDLADAETLRAGQEPREFERLSAKMREAVVVQIEQFPWLRLCTRRARLDIEEALFDKAIERRADIWASRLGVALEEMSRQWIEPLREAAMAKGCSTLDLGYKQPDSVRTLRDKFTLGKMKDLMGCWFEGQLNDEVVLAFLKGRSNRIRKTHRKLITRAAELRNSAIHAAPFDDANALELHDVAFELFPLLAGHPAR